MGRSDGWKKREGERKEKFGVQGSVLGQGGRPYAVGRWAVGTEEME